MRSTLSILTLVLTVFAACRGEGPEEEAPADTADQEEVIAVPDSMIERELSTRIEADPRLDKEGVEIAVRADAGVVRLVGNVPTRLEMSIAREVALSSPGVRSVSLDSLVIASDAGSRLETAPPPGT